jgi:ADP-heptose:LPS heptosyltransferase
MHLNTMRRVDYWVGVPACFILSFFSSIVTFFFQSSRRPASPRRVLFIELSEMGSAVLAYPSLQRTAKLFPGVERYFLIFKKNRESCDILGVIPHENVLVIDERSLVTFLTSTISVIFKIWRLKIDATIDLELFSRCTALLTLFSRAPIRVGFDRGTSEGLYRGKFLTHPVVYNPHTHIALNFLALVESLVSDPQKIPVVKADLSQHLIPLPLIENTEAEKRTIRGALAAASKAIPNAKFIVFNPDPGDALPLRGWPVDRYVSVARELLEEDPNHVIVVMGLKRSKPYADRLIHELGASRCIDFTNKTANLREVLALLNASALLVTNDSGPAHMASLTSVPTIVLYGPETPALYGPLSERAVSLFAKYSCSPCLSAMNHRESQCSENLCMQAITVDQVVRTARALLARGGKLVVYNQRAA